jgi:tryptophan 2,3-dioxygenase
VLLGSLKDWCSQPQAARFPYPEVLDEFRRVGKHFVAADVLDALACARSAIAASREPAAALLRDFLDVALDKYDKQYEYLSYTALSLLGLADSASGQPKPIEQRTADRLLMLLVADALAFELAAPHAPLPRMRPPAQTVVKRCRLGLRVLSPALARAGMPPPSGCDLAESARATVSMLCGTMSDAERLAIRLSMLPVDTLHDEYLFIRVLQSFETFFASMCWYLRRVIRDLNAGTAAASAAGLDSCAIGFREAAPLFSLLATMQADAFRTFRMVTEGASAIQSVGYKSMESLCRRPDPRRLDSIAYRSVPGVRDGLQAGPPNVQDSYRAAVAVGRFDVSDASAVAAAMSRLGAAHHRWRQTHVRLAARMLGDVKGTGYTEGVPYLEAVLDTPLFQVAAGHVWRHDEAG